MFEKGDYIVYGNTGICSVEDVTTMQLPGIPQDKLYYVMEPYGQKGRKIFTPVDNPKMTLRRVLTRVEALALIDEMPQIQELQIPQEKLREQWYKDHLRSCECRDWISMIKTLYQRRVERIQIGKKVTATDERYFKLAEDNLCTEFSISLGITPQEVTDFIQDRIGQTESSMI